MRHRSTSVPHGPSEPQGRRVDVEHLVQAIQIPPQPQLGLKRCLGAGRDVRPQQEEWACQLAAASVLALGRALFQAGVS